MPEISAVIITYNEEDFIGKCLESLEGVADEIVVVDSFSTDRTEEICRKYNVRFTKHAFEGYRDQKNYAIRFATHKHILSLDADEALSDKLRESILKIKNDWKFDGYRMNRKNFFCGKWIRFSNWYPDKQLRLFNADFGSWGGFNLHEKVVMAENANVGTLKGDLLHWAFTSEEEFLEKMKRYSELGGREYYKAGKKSYLLKPYVHMIWGFIRSYFIKGGILDGRYGYLICSNYSKYAFKKHKIQRDLYNQQKNI